MDKLQKSNEMSTLNLILGYDSNKGNGNDLLTANLKNRKKINNYEHANINQNEQLNTAHRTLNSVNPTNGYAFQNQANNINYVEQSAPQNNYVQPSYVEQSTPQNNYVQASYVEPTQLNNSNSQTNYMQTNADVVTSYMPSSVTMSHLDENDKALNSQLLNQAMSKPNSLMGDTDLNDYASTDSEGQVKTNEVYSIKLKFKLLVALYSIVIATIVAVIAINGQILKDMEKSIDNYNVQINQLQLENQQLTSELEYTMSDEVISQKAQEMGMIKD